MRLTVLRNDAHVPMGHLERVARDRSVEIEVVALDCGDRVPSVEEVDAVAVLGGSMGAYDEEAFPFLVDEKRFLREAVDRGVPVLGICLGCQLLADTLGGRAYLAPRPEIVFDRLQILVADPVVDVFGEVAFLSIHRDTWDPPPEATLLARSAAYNQAFRLGSALGVQSHPEVTPTIVESWMTHEDGAVLAAGAGTTPQAVMEEIADAEPSLTLAADRFFGAWIDEAIDRSGRV